MPSVIRCSALAAAHFDTPFAIGLRTLQKHILIKSSSSAVRADAPKADKRQPNTMDRELSIESSPTAREEEDPPTSGMNEKLQDDNIQEGEVTRASSTGPELPYSIWSRSQKAVIVTVVSFAALFSPFTINIYFPAILDMTVDMHTTLSLMNLSITIYMIFQGLTPGIFAAFSDSIGRRPTYIFCFVVYILSNIGLALTPTYWLLMLLRAIQATGNSATVALGAGVIADIATPKERGGYLGIFGVGPLAGPSLGPIIGGILAQTLGWRSIFWFLTIFGGTFSVALLLFLPETLRSIVGNGSVKPTSVWHIRFVELWSRRKNVIERGDAESQTEALNRTTLSPKKRTNLLESFIIILQKDVPLILFIPSIHYTVYVMVTTSIPPLFSAHYNLSTLHIGLTYLALGCGTMIGSIGWGKLLDRDWKIVEQRHIEKGYKKPSNPLDLLQFPVEYARSRSVWWPMAAFWVASAGYGWTVQYNVNLAVPLIFQAVIGCTTVCIMSSFQALLLDLHPGRSASAAASLNIVRCWIGAGGSAVIQPMLRSLDVGWTYTLLSLLCLVTSVPAVLAENKWGMTWRQAREKKLEEKKRRKAEAEVQQASDTAQKSENSN